MKKQLVYIGLIALCLAACRQSVSQKGVASVNAAELYKDSVFLEIKGDNLDALFFEGRVDPRIYYPAVDFSKLQEVLVITTTKQDLTNQDEGSEGE